MEIKTEIKHANNGEDSGIVYTIFNTHVNIKNIISIISTIQMIKTEVAMWEPHIIIYWI